LALFLTLAVLAGRQAAAFDRTPRGAGRARRIGRVIEPTVERLGLVSVKTNRFWVYIST